METETFYDNGKLRTRYRYKDGKNHAFDQISDENGDLRNRV